MSSDGGGGGKKTVEEIYQKLEPLPLEHILLRPDTFIGSVQPTTGGGGDDDEGHHICAWVLQDL